MRKFDYAVLIEPRSDEDGGGFLATVPDLSGCMSDGDARGRSEAYRGRHRLLAGRSKSRMFDRPSFIANSGWQAHNKE